MCCYGGCISGLSFFFRVNSVPIYAKGANLIPFDAFHPRIGPSNFTRMLTNAVQANINIVRCALSASTVYSALDFGC
jgi:beta-galactosidase/beta-glucuronidase